MFKLMMSLMVLGSICTMPAQSSEVDKCIVIADYTIKGCEQIEVADVDQIINVILVKGDNKEELFYNTCASNPKCILLEITQ